MISYEMLVRTRPVLKPYITVAIAQSGELESKLDVESLEERWIFLESFRRHKNLAEHNTKRKSEQADMII
jgi:hypothetical protein